MPSMEYKDYYETLGVPRTAAQAESKKAFRKLAREHHPDVRPGDATAEDRFKDVNEAHGVLSDPAKRRQYDTLGANWGAYTRGGGDPFGPGGPFADYAGYGGPGGNVRFEFRTTGDAGGFSDFFRTFFGGGSRLKGRGGDGRDLHVIVRLRPHPVFTRRGADLERELPLTLREALLGGEVPVATLKSRVLLRIPAGTQNGRTFRLKGQGMPRLNGGEAGDLYAKARVVLPTGLSPEATTAAEHFFDLVDQPDPRAGTACRPFHPPA